MGYDCRLPDSDLLSVNDLSASLRLCNPSSSNGVSKYPSLLSEDCSAWHLCPWTNGDPHRSVFQFHTAVLPVLCVMSQVQLSFVPHLLNVYLNILLLFRWLQLLPVRSISHFMFHICSVSVHWLLYFSLFSAAFCVTFLSAAVATYVSIHVFSLILF